MGEPLLVLVAAALVSPALAALIFLPIAWLEYRERVRHRARQLDPSWRSPTERRREAAAAREQARIDAAARRLIERSKERDSK